MKEREVSCLKGIILKELGIDPAEMSRKRVFIDGRLIFSKLLVERGWPYEDIGAALGGKDHSTITHYMDSLSGYMVSDKILMIKLNRCRDLFDDRLPRKEVAIKPFKLFKRMLTSLNPLVPEGKEEEAYGIMVHLFKEKYSHGRRKN